MKTVIITGAGGNLGAAAVSVFANAGWRVAALVTPGKTPTSSLNGVDFYEADLLDEAATSALVASLWTKYGSIDTALMLVGGFESGNIADTGSEALRRMFALNVETAYHVARPLFTRMQASGGNLVFVGARPAMNATAGKSLVAYGLSKSQLFKLAEYLNAASTVVRSHVVVFTALDTPQNRASMPTSDRAGWVAPEKVATVILTTVTAGDSAAVIEVA